MTRLERAIAKRTRRAAHAEAGSYAANNMTAGAAVERKKWWDRSWVRTAPAGDEPEQEPQRTRRPKDVALRTAIREKQIMEGRHRQPPRRRPQGGAR